MFVMGTHSFNVVWGMIDPGSAAVDAEPGDPTATPPVPSTPAIAAVPPTFGFMLGELTEPQGNDGLSRINVRADRYNIPAYEDWTPAMVTAYEAILNSATTTFPLDFDLDNADDPLVVAFRDAMAAGNFNIAPVETGLTGFSVGDNGDVSVMMGARKVVIARLSVAMFSNPGGLERAGGSLYRETASSGPVLFTEALEDGAGPVTSFGLEMSNVDVATEFTDMIVTQREFQANYRIITVTDAMLEELVNLKR